MKNFRIFILFLLPFSVLLSGSSGGCASHSAVYSDEVSTAAQDMNFLISVSEYNRAGDSDWVFLNAYFRTPTSSTDIFFNTGETLSVQYETEAGLSEPSFFYQSDGEGLLANQFRAIVLQTIPGGTYLVTYTDRDDVQTTVSIQSNNTLDLTNLSDGDIVTENPVTITWNPSLVTEDLSITYSCGSESGRESDVGNTGSYELIHNCSSGSGEIRLEHEQRTTDSEAFHQEEITMTNTVEKNVTFDVE